LGNTDRFTTAQLEERMAKNGAIDMPERKKSKLNPHQTYNADNRSGQAIYESRRQAMVNEIDDADLNELSD